MARPSKPVDVIEAEGKSHRTKKEKAYRKQQEEATLTGRKMQEPAEVKADRIAHLTFLRTRRLLQAIDKDDELYLAATIRYCQNTSRLNEAEHSISVLREALDKIRNNSGDMDMETYYSMLIKLENSITAKEKLAQSIRNELAAYEKENCMTIAASLRSIPKTPPSKTSALKEALSGP